MKYEVKNLIVDLADSTGASTGPIPDLSERDSRLSGQAPVKESSAENVEPSPVE